jgi:hypothetical protein
MEEKQVYFMLEVANAEYEADFDEYGNPITEEQADAGKQWTDLSRGSITLCWKECSTKEDIEQHKIELSKQYQVEPHRIWHIVVGPDL